MQSACPIKYSQSSASWFHHCPNTKGDTSCYCFSIKLMLFPFTKNGNHQDPANYRPISLTSIVYKLFVALHIANHLEHNATLYDLQYGFRRQRSCESQLLSLVHDLMVNFDCNTQTDLVLMDLSKAFDRVPNERLLYKLHILVWCTWSHTSLDTCLFDRAHTASCPWGCHLCHSSSYLWCATRFCIGTLTLHYIH